MLTTAILGLLLGAVVGAVATLLALGWWFRDPEHAKDLLRGAAESAHKRVAHPHWLNESENDPRVICPCCGWSEKRGVLPPGTIVSAAEEHRHGE